MKKFIVCDIGKKQTYVFVPDTKNHYQISNEEFIQLIIPELNGHDIVIEDTHLRSQENNSLAQSWTIEQLIKFRSIADSKNIEILCFPQKVTPKARKIASIEVRPELLEKDDKNDIESIAFYLEKFSEAYDSLKVFDPVPYEDFEKKVSHIYRDRDSLTEDSNSARNEKYGIKTDYEDAVTSWIKKYINILAFNLDDDTREWSGLEMNAKGNALKPGMINYTSDKLKFIYGVINTILTPTGKLRLRSDIKKPPYWKYAKQVYFGLTPYHMHAGVTASNYKYHKRKAGSSCKKSMSLESKNAVKDLNDIREIREAMKESDRKLRTLWRTARKMIVEDGLR
ncbi:MAG: hypothetical protein ACO372_06480, partial [Methylophilaceae bacterium]